MKQKIAVVTGANRGLGLGCAKELVKKGFSVYLCARKESSLQEIVEELKSEGGDVNSLSLDVANDESVHQFVDKLKALTERVDVLINNAGVFFEEDKSVFSVNPARVLETLNVNTVGCLRVIQALRTFLGNSEAPRVVNVSSGMGQISVVSAGSTAYRMSKAALNMLTQSVALEWEGTPLKVNSVCPGWVRTDMGGSAAYRSVEEGVKGILWAATLEDDGPTGAFFRDAQALDW